VRHKGEGEEGCRIKSIIFFFFFFFSSSLKTKKKKANEKGFENVEAFSLSWLGGEFVPLDVFGFDWK
jgi:hypothetical protein